MKRRGRQWTVRTMRIEFVETTDSTNEYIKRYVPTGENVIVCATRQTGGRGTKGRSFSSEAGGVYLSALTFYRDFPAKDAFRIMTHAAVAVCRTAEAFGVVPEIKWANDVLTYGKKLSGILIENQVEDGRLKYSIVGIGMNACNDLSAVRDVAVSLSEACGRNISAEEARGVLIENYLREDTFDDYLSYVRFLGREVEITEGSGEAYRAQAVRILGDGRLQVKKNGQTRTLSAAEIKLRL